MHKVIRNCFCSAILFVALGTGAAYADSITASLYSPLAPAGTLTPINLTGITTPDQGTIVGKGYTITFNNVASNQGVVQGNLSTAHAVPVAGVSGSTPLYLSGNYGSSLTNSVADSGNYFSTGLGTITITFSTPQRALALLWGSIDKGNVLTFNDAADYTVTGTLAQQAAAGFLSNGFQGAGGSAYVIINTSTPFTTVTATSDVPSFEFAGIVGNTALFSTPEPSSWALLPIGGLLIAFGVRRRKSSQLS